MANVAASFESVFGEPRADDQRYGPVRTRRWYASRESWLTLALLMFSLFPVIASLTTAEWVPEMPSMWLASGAGLAAGWLLAHSRVPGVLASMIAAALGIAVAIGLVIERMTVTEPGLGEGMRGRWTEFWLRLDAWGHAVWDRAPSTDPLAFVVLLIAVVFGIAYMSSWAVVRWHNAWLALIPGGIVLLTNISYLPGQPSIALIIYLFAAVLLVTRLEYLRSVMRWRAEHVHPPELMSFAVLVIGAMVAIILVSAAWFVPTANHWGPVADAWQRAMAPVASRVEAFGEIFIGVSSKKPVPVHSFGATLPLQGKMTLSNVPLYDVVASEPGNLRGAVYDSYSGGGWRVSSATARPLSGTTVQAAGLGTPMTRAQVRRPVTTEVTVLSDGAPDRRLLTVGDALTTDVPAGLLIDPLAQPIGLAPESPAAPGIEYASVGSVSAASVGTLRSAGAEYPPDIVAVYTQLPDDLPAEVADLSGRLVTGAENPYDAARRIETYLRSTYRYTLEPPAAPPRRDAVAAFLFDQRAGYFDQFASSMAVMLRTVGIPSRVATGFVLDPIDLNSETKAYSVSELRAWTWTEVYFPGLGWVESNPTPGRPLVQRAGDDSAALAAAANVMPADIPGIDGLPFEDDLEFDWDESFVFPGSTTATGRMAEILVQVISTLLLVSAGVLVVLIVLKVAWERQFAGLRPAASRWARVQRLAQWAGISPPDYLTPAESAQALATAIGGEAPALRTLSRQYTRDRYGRDHEDEDEDAAREADQDYRRVRDRLRGMVIYRVFHFGRARNQQALPRRRSAAEPTGRR